MLYICELSSETLGTASFIIFLQCSTSDNNPQGLGVQVEGGKCGILQEDGGCHENYFISDVSKKIEPFKIILENSNLDQGQPPFIEDYHLRSPCGQVKEVQYGPIQEGGGPHESSGVLEFSKKTFFDKDFEHASIKLIFGTMEYQATRIHQGPSSRRSRWTWKRGTKWISERRWFT